MTNVKHLLENEQGFIWRTPKPGNRWRQQSLKILEIRIAEWDIYRNIFKIVELIPD